MLISKDKKYRKGEVIGLYMAVFSAIFSGIMIPICIALDNFAFLGIGPAIGAGIGLAIGQEIENKLEAEGKVIDSEPYPKPQYSKIILIAVAALLVTAGIIFLALSIKGKL